MMTTSDARKRIEEKHAAEQREAARAAHNAERGQQEHRFDHLRRPVNDWLSAAFDEFARRADQAIQSGEADAGEILGFLKHNALNDFADMWEDYLDGDDAA